MIRMIDTSDALLTRAEVAKLLSVAPHTLACWRSAGKGPEVVKFGTGRSAAVRYRRSAVEAWLAAVGSQPPGPAHKAKKRSRARGR